MLFCILKKRISAPMNNTINNNTDNSSYSLYIVLLNFSCNDKKKI